MTTPALSTSDLLTSLLLEFGTKPKKPGTKAQGKPQATKPQVQPARTQAESLNKARTGYLAWKPIGRALWFRVQHCQCCGHETTFVENELYILKHGKSQSVWYRREGLEPGLNKDLALEIHRVQEPLLVSVCSECQDDRALDNLVTLLSSPQQAFSF